MISNNKVMLIIICLIIVILICLIIFISYCYDKENFENRLFEQAIDCYKYDNIEASETEFYLKRVDRSINKNDQYKKTWYTLYVEDEFGEEYVFECSYDQNNNYELYAYNVYKK